MPQIEREFGALYFRVKGTGPNTVVLLHDYFGTHQGWETHQSQLSKYFTVLAPDLRGHGKSVLKDGGLSIADMAGDVIAMLDFVGAERAHMVGASQGGVVAMHLARNVPERVESLVVTSAPNLDRPGTLEYGRTYAQSVFPRLEAEMQRSHGDGNSRYARDVLLKSFLASVENPPNDHLDAFRKAHEIACPALVLGGDSDPVMDPATALALAHRIEAASLSILPATGHLAHHESPVLYLETLLDHLWRSQAI